MKGTNLMLTALLWTSTVSPAWADCGTRAAGNGSLVVVFLGFSALVLVAQLIPSIITMWEALKDTKASEVGR